MSAAADAPFWHNGVCASVLPELGQEEPRQSSGKCLFMVSLEVSEETKLPNESQPLSLSLHI